MTPVDHLAIFLTSVMMTWGLIRFGPICDALENARLARQARKACPMCQGVVPAVICAPDYQRDVLCGAHLGQLMRIERLERAVGLTS